MVLFQQSGFIRAKVVVTGKSGCIRAKWFVRDIMVVFGKVVVFWQKWLYSGRSGSF